MVTWKEIITQSLEDNKESWNHVVSMSPKNDKWLNYYFDDDSNKIEGEFFTLWTKSRVYFPVQYNGIEWVESVSRNPDDKPTRHIGG